MAQAVQHALAGITIPRIAMPRIDVARLLDWGIPMSWVRIEIALLIGAFMMAA